MNKIISELPQSKVVAAGKTLFECFLYGVVAITIIVIAFTGLIFFAFDCYPPLPSDNELIARFNANKPYFDQVLKMANKDRTVVTTSYWRGLPEWRGEEYKALFHRLGVGGIVAYPKRGIIVFSVTERMSGESKGYAYLIGKARFIVPSLDDHSLLGFWYEHRNDPQLQKEAFRDLGDGWYLWRNSQWE